MIGGWPTVIDPVNETSPDVPAVQVVGSVATCVMPELELFESAGAAAESCAEILIALAVQVEGVFVLQLIAVVNEKDCGPVPAGGAIPGVMLTVNFHVVFDGKITPPS